MFPPLRANGNKIGRMAAIIPILQSGRRNAVFISEFVGHYYWISERNDI